MSEVLRAEWFDLADGARADAWAWLHDEYLPALQAARGVAWVGHYDIVEQPDRPYIEGAPAKKETQDSDLPTGWQNVVLTASVSPFQASLPPEYPIGVRWYTKPRWDLVGWSFD